MRSLHTPQQETNSAYNPGVTFHGGQFLAQGISQAGGAIAEGFKQFQRNREERDFADERMKALAARIGQFQDFEKTANEDDTSPAGQFIKTFANWDNLPLAKKKASIMDAEMFVNKQEQEQRRIEEQQWKMLDQQRSDAQFENLQKYQADMLGLSRQGMAWEAMRTMGSLWNQGRDNSRADERLGMDRQNFANLEEQRRARLASDARMAANVAQFQTLAAEPTGPSRMGGDALAALYSQPGTGLPDFSAYGPRDTQLTQQPLSTERIAQLGAQTGAWQHPQFDNLAKLYQGAQLDPISQLNADAAMMNAKTNAAEAARRANGGGDKPARIRVTTKIGDQTIEREVTKEEADRLLKESRPAPDPQLAGALAELLEMKKRGVKEAKLGEGGKVHEGGMMTFGEQPIDEVIARVRAQLGGTGVSAADPAAASSEVKRTTSDGRTAVFDATTKKFLRYAD